MVRNRNHDIRHYSANYVTDFPVPAVYLVQIYTTFRDFVLTCITEIKFKFLFLYYFFQMSNDFILVIFKDAFNR